jgi:hypothetical protein
MEGDRQGREEGRYWEMGREVRRGSKRKGRW